MDVNPEDPTTKLIQATLHNLSTVERDFAMIRPVLQARGGDELLERVEEAYDAVTDGYNSLLSAFALVVENGTHSHDHDGVHVHATVGTSPTHTHVPSMDGIAHPMLPAV